MKRSKNGLKWAFLLFIAAFTSQPRLIHAQSTKADKQAAKKAAIQTLIDSQAYVFIAQSAMPMSGPIRQLTSDYDLKVTKKEVVSYLPYFGRAYSAPMDASQGGIRFTSADFEYSLSPRKKGGWDILIKPKDTREVQQLTLNLGEDGYGSLQVTSTNRQPISFNGHIIPIRIKTKKTN